jgi:alpha-beta hydrolase superfamily lysophospholipase
MVCSTSYIETTGGTKLFLRRWSVPDAPPGATARAVVNIVHGMTEHGGRYEWTAAALVRQGYEVWAADMRGHGKTADPAVNALAEGGLIGHCADKNAPEKLIADIDAVNTAIKKAHPGLPLFLLGHSWGSFLTQAYIEGHSEAISGCILSGTMGPAGPFVRFGVSFLALWTSLFGVRNRSRFVHRLAKGSYNKHFKPQKTSFDWGSRDEAEVAAFLADPFCTHISTAGFYRDMVGILSKAGKTAEMAKIRRDLPLYLFSGSADPVGEMGQGPARLVHAYQKLDIRDIEYALYPGARHEVLHETNREEAIANLLGWLNKQSGIIKE